MKKSCILIFVLICSSIFKCSCDDNNPVKPKTVSIEELNQLGWQEFTEKNYDMALTYFNEVLFREKDNISANMGTGWTLLVQDSVKQSIIIQYLKKGTLDNSWKLDAYCGLSVIRFINREYFEIEQFVNIILEENPDYFFKYRPSIDWHDLLLMKAQALFFTKKYIESLETIEQLTSIYSLDPDKSSTWIVNNENFFSFEAALSKIIEILSEIYKEPN